MPVIFTACKSHCGLQAQQVNGIGHQIVPSGIASTI